MKAFRFLTVCFVLLLAAATANAALPKVSLYLPFDGNASPAIGGKSDAIHYQKKGATPQFAEGISGQGFVTGGKDEEFIVAAQEYLDKPSWTITFWVKGMPNAAWNEGQYIERLWRLVSKAAERGSAYGGFMIFQAFPKARAPYITSAKDKDAAHIKTYFSPVSEQEWHYYAVTWTAGSNGIYLYQDGQLLGQGQNIPPSEITQIGIGQNNNAKSPPASNKIIDEFKIFDGALSAGEIAQQYWVEGKKPLKPQITVMPKKGNVSIDGVITDNEWQDAAGFVNFIDRESWNSASPQTTGKITYDDNNIYVAMHSDDQPEAANNPDIQARSGYIKQTAAGLDSNVADDDHFVVSLTPPASKVTYIIRINSKGAVWDGTKDATGNEDLKWNSQLLTRSVLDEKGWSAEIAIPLKSLGMSSIAKGEPWRANVGRIWKRAMQREDLWAPANKGTIVFGDTVATVLRSFVIDNAGNFSSSLSFINTTNADQQVEVTLSAGDKTLQREKVLLKAQENKTVRFDNLPADANGASAQVTVRKEEKVLLSQAQPIIVSDVGHLLLWNYPSYQQIRLGWDLHSASAPDALSIDINLLKDGKNVTKWNIPQLSSLHDSKLIDVKDIAPDRYEIKVEVREGKNLLQQETLPYEKKPLPDWLGNTLGISKTPPSPWTNVNVDQAKDSISIWGRTYAYDKKLFPHQIVNQGKDMLAAPMRLVVKNENKTYSSDEQNAQTKWDDISAIRAVSDREQIMGDVTLSSNSYTEFDGFSWTTMVVSPNRTDASLDELTLEIPLKNEWAELLKPGQNDYNLEQTGLLSEKGWKGAASMMPWIGNGNGGIQFLLESTAHWKGSKTIEVVPGKEGQTVMKVHLVDVNTVLSEPLHLSFGWTVSPVKAAPQHHRDWRIFHGIVSFTRDGGVAEYVKEAVKTHPSIMPWSTWWQGWWWLPEGFEGSPDRGGYLPVWQETARKGKGDWKESYYQLDDTTIPKAAYNRITGMFGTNNPWFEQFGDEWVTDVSKFSIDKTDVRQFTTVSQNSRSLRDFYLWGINQLFDATDAKALYFDVSGLHPDSNIYHGAGTVLADGTIEPFNNILGLRKVMMRIYTLLKQRHPDGMIIYHMSGSPLLSHHGFADVLLDGENFTHMLDRKENRGYEKVLSLDQFRAEYNAQNNYGPATAFLPEFNRAKAMTAADWQAMGFAHADYLLGLIFLHDSNLRWAHLNGAYSHVGDVFSAIDNTGRDSTWNFIPYWNQKYFSTPADVNVSIYQSPDGKKALLILMNTSGEDQDITVPTILGKSTFTDAKAIYPAQPLQGGNGNAQKIHVANNGFSAVLLERE